MKNRFFYLAVTIVFLGLYACSDVYPVLDEFSSCDDSEVLNETDTESTIVLELLANDPLTITNPEMAISVYGADASMADIPASLITKQCLSVDELPVLLSIDIPKNPTDKVEFLNNPENERYYVGIEWDSDGNGKICEGDIFQAYDPSICSVTIDINGTEKYLLYLLENESVPCD